MFPNLNIFGLSLPVSPFSILMGIWVGLSLAEKYANKYKLSADTLYNLVFYSLISGILGGRLSYILQFPQFFIDDPASIISLNFGLFDITGSLALAIIFAIVYGQKKGMKILPTLDGLTLFFASLAIAIAFANLASGNSYGIPTEMPWAIDLWNASRHPTQFYALIGSIIILWTLIPRGNFKNNKGGLTILIFITLTAMLHILISPFIGNPVLLSSTFRLVQLWWFSVLLFSLYGLNRLHQNLNSTVK